jgi:hypothetical protein
MTFHEDSLVDEASCSSTIDTMPALREERSARLTGKTSPSVPAPTNPGRTRPAPESTAAVMVNEEVIGITYTRLPSGYEVAYGRAGVSEVGGRRKVFHMGWGRLSRDRGHIDKALMRRLPEIYVASEDESSRWVSDNLLAHSSQ